MSDEIVQLGTSLMISAGAFALTGYVISEDGNLSWTKVRDIKEIMDINGATFTKLLKNPKQEFSGTLIVLSTVGSYTPLQTGTAVSITDPDGDTIVVMIAEWTPDYSSEDMKVAFKFVKEDSMTYIV